MRWVPDTVADRLPGRRRTQGDRLERPPRPGAVRRALLLWGMLVALFAGGLVFLFFYSAAFVVEEISVEGADGELADSVVHHADIPVGRPLARVSEHNLAERVVEGERRVRSVSLDRDYPSSITYTVELREPALALRRGKTTWLADEGGVVYEEVEEASNKLPAVAVSEEPADLDQETVRGLVELWRTRPDPSELEGELDTPEMDRNGAVSLTIDQVTVLWGEPTDIEKKWQVVQALVEQDSIDPQGGIAQTIDVRVPDAPSVQGIPAAPPPAQG
ncbi:cell division protein FtsQ/DivIB [Ornithinimicrobium sp. W1665]